MSVRVCLVKCCIETIEKKKKNYISQSQIERSYYDVKISTRVHRLLYEAAIINRCESCIFVAAAVIVCVQYLYNFLSAFDIHISQCYYY